MGQEEVICWLAARRASGCEDFFSIAEVEKGVDHLGHVRRQVNRLIAYDEVEVKVVNGWQRLIRAKEGNILISTQNGEHVDK